MSGSRFTRQGVATLLGMAAAVLVFAASASAAPLVLVGNQAGESVSVIDSQSHAILGGPIALGTEAGAITIVPGGMAYVAEPEEDEVAVINPQTRKLVTTIPVGDEPIYLAVSPDGKTVYVADDGEPTITIISTGTNAVAGSIPLADTPFGVTFTPDGKFAYVSVNNTQENQLDVIETATREVVGEPIEVGEDPLTTAFSPDGSIAYTANESSNDVSVVNTATRQTVGTIKFSGSAYVWGLAMSPDGSKLYVSDLDQNGIRVVSTTTRKQVGATIPTGEQPYEIALTPDGKTLWVAAAESDEAIPVDTATATAGTPVQLPSGTFPWQVAITPDQSPTAIFSPPSVTEGVPATFDGGASVDPDGTIASYSWAFGDEFSDTGVAPTHTFAKSGTYNTELSVVDNEGCGAGTLLLGRTAYCGGNPLAKVVHPTEVKVGMASLCSSRFRLGGLTHKRKNGTARLQVKAPGPGSIFLFGKKVHAVTRKTKKAGSMWLTIHARVELNKQLKKTHRAQVKVRVTFTPTGACGTPTTLHTSFALLRAPHKHHRG